MSKIFELKASLDCNSSVYAYESLRYKGAVILDIKMVDSVATIMLTKDEVVALIDGLQKLTEEMK